MVNAKGAEFERRKPSLLLFDGNSIVHRAFHALPPLSAPKTGEIVSAVYGFANTLLKVTDELKPAYWACAFDRPSPTFRHKAFEEYKAQRPKIPQELKNQIELVHRLVESFHIPIFEIDGFEADDILGTLSKKASKQGIDVVIVTSDNDMLQVISPSVKALMPKRIFKETTLYDEQTVNTRYSIKCAQIPDFKALVGDPSDNIPGIPGIGEKTAAKLLQDFGDLEGIYAHIEEVMPEKLRAVLSEHLPQAFRNRKLTTIVRDVPIDFTPEACRVSAYDRDKVVSLFRELGFIELLSRLPHKIAGERSIAEIKILAETNYQVVNSEAAFDRLIAQLENTRNFTISIEGAGKQAIAAELVGIAISLTSGEAFYIPVGHYGLSQPAQLPLPQVVTKLKPILENPQIGKFSYDSKRNMMISANYGVQFKNLTFDVMIAAHLVGEGNLRLKALAFNRLGMEIVSTAELIGTGKKQIPIATLGVEQVAKHACTDIEIIRRLKDNLEKELKQLELWTLFNELEMPLAPVLVAMERNGIALDADLLGKLSGQLGEQIANREAEIYNCVGHKFNISSPQQLARVLFEELRLAQPRKTKTGYSTQASTLEALRGLHPIIALVLEYRQLSKLKSTYADALPALINSETHRVHTTFNQTGTATGRLSSSEPNLQNIPIREETGRMIRKAIIAPPGAYLLGADYSQIDLRVLAHLSGDPGLIAVFANDEDVHAATASKLFGIPKKEISPEMRRVAKTVNFGVIYGMSDYGLEQATELNREEAAQFIDSYFDKYPEVRRYIERTKEQARDLGYVQTLMGRRRFIPEINSPNRQIREAAERMAINAPVQGTSADIIKIAMVNMHQEMKERNLKSKMLLQIHDELLFEVPEKEVSAMKEIVSEVMCQAVNLCVSLRVNIKLGRNWDEMM
jgi:DNA polymerase-1